MLTRLDVARPGSVILWAVLCGLVAGLVAATYLRIVGEPLVDRAIAIEEATAAASSETGGDDIGHPAEEEHADDAVEIGRPTQKGVGLFSAYALFGGACGLLLAAAALSLRGEWLDPFRRIAVAGSILALSITVVPWFEFPPNPPAVGDPSTAGERQRWFFILVALTAVVLAGAAHLSGRLRRAEWPDFRRVAVVGAAAAVVLGVIVALMPGNDDPIPEAVGASLVWEFRVASLGGNVLMWALLTVGFGVLCAESARRRSEAAAATAAVGGTGARAGGSEGAGATGGAAAAGAEA
ncbi:MAG TPA: CbtA family protein [Acidimicrobiales bacterium]